MTRTTVQRTFLALFMVGIVASTAVGQTDSGDGESRTLTTADGWTIPINYLESKSGKESPVVIMFPGVEGKKDSRTRKAWSGVAKALNKKGFAVVTADLRKHGDSVHISGTAKAVTKLLPADYTLMAAQDLSAIKNFLVTEHEKQKLNIRKLGIATSGSGALVSAGFAAIDWAQKPWPDASVYSMRTPKGQDVRALFWISPGSVVRGISTTTIMKTVGDPQKAIAAHIWYNPSQRKEKASAEKLWNYLDPKDEQYDSVRKLNEGPEGPASESSGEALLEGRAGPIMEGHIVKFFEDNLKVLEFPWKTRKSRL
ncbi:MAG: hypothetical protein ABJZ55_06665 [Fuerstiella sp.]